MSKDNRHDGRRRGTGQHRVGPRSNQGMDGRERSGSNSSGSSHGGGKTKNSPLSALKVRENLPFFFGLDFGIEFSVHVKRYMNLRGFSKSVQSFLAERTCRRCDG